MTHHRADVCMENNNGLAKFLRFKPFRKLQLQFSRKTKTAYIGSNITQYNQIVPNFIVVPDYIYLTSILNP
jgi:hypothetical protein